MAARRDGTKLAALPADCAPRDEREAYAIQDAVLAARRNPPGRIACWKSTLFDAVTGISAPIAEYDLLPSPAVLSPRNTGTLGTQSFGIEPEVAFRMGRTLAPRADGWSREAVAAAIGSAHAVFEICVARLADYAAAPALDQLADFIQNEALVYGPALSDWRRLDLPRLALQVRVEGELVHEAVGGHPLDDPLAPVVWLANHLSERGLALEAGCIVTTGSFNGLRTVPAGQRCEAVFSGLGSAEVRFAV